MTLFSSIVSARILYRYLAILGFAFAFFGLLYLGVANSQSCGWEENYASDPWGGCWGPGEDRPIEVSLVANPMVVAPGEQSVLSWGGAGDSCWTDGLGYDTVPINGTRTVSPTQTTTYMLSCSGMISVGYGSVQSSDSASVTVTVTAAPQPTATLNANPSTINDGEQSALSWASTNAASCTGTGFSTGSATSGTLNVSPSATTNYSVTCTGAGGSATAAATLTVNAAPVLAADLTAGTVSPSSAMAGTPVTFSATASNAGTATSGSFPVLFEIENGSVFNSGYVSALASGASSGASASHTFASAGTYRLRACANFNTSWTAITPESDYSNNCGPWTTITVSSAPSTSLSCNVSDDTVASGDTVTYSVSGGAEPYAWTPSDGVGNYGSAAHVNRNFSAEGNYGMTVSKSGYTSGNCPVVVVGPASGPACLNTAVDITASPERIRQGETTTVSYTASGVNTSCVITGPGAPAPIAASACAVPGGSFTTPALSTQTTYTITCDDVSDQVIVNVLPKYIEI